MPTFSNFTASAGVSSPSTWAAGLRFTVPDPPLLNVPVASTVSTPSDAERLCNETVQLLVAFQVPAAPTRLIAAASTV